MLTESQMNDARSVFKGPYGWRDCDRCGNFIAPGEPECPNPMCAVARAADEVAMLIAKRRDEMLLEAFAKPSEDRQ